MSNVLESLPRSQPPGLVSVPFNFVSSVSPALSKDLVLAAFALTLSRWTGETDSVIAVKGSNSEEFTLCSVARIVVNDQITVDEFLDSIRLAELSQTSGDLVTALASVDLVVISGQEDLRFGTLEFIAEISDEEAFLADTITALDGLAMGGALLQEVRCIAPERRYKLDAMIGADVPVVGIEMLLKKQVEQHSEKIAVRDAGIEVTYAQLWQAADKFATELQNAGVCCGDKVLVATRPSIAEIVAVIATVRLGATYAGFVDDDPEARTKLMVDRLSPVVAVVDSTTADHPGLKNIACIDAWCADQSGSRKQSGDFQAIGDAAHNAVFVSFTSGTTGEPKGVIITQKAVTRLALSPELRIYPEDRVLRMAPLTFDTSQFEIWGTLLNGATLEVFPSNLPVLGKVERFFIERKVSVAWLTAGLFRLIAKSRPKTFGGLRWIITGGEVVPHESAAQMLEMHPKLTITNGYGPTENTTFTTTFTVHNSQDISGPLPIGRPIAGTKIFVLDHNARLVPPGAIGELYAGGTGIADGYLNDLVQTNSRFGNFCPDVDERLYRTGDLVRVDSDNNLMFLGRADKQIKLNGYRIELDEINAALIAHSEVLDALVVVSKHAESETRLVAAVVGKTQSRPSPKLLKEYLSGLLPSYAVPTLWAVVSEIPITRNGKVAERKLIEAAKPVAHVESAVK